jgi:predicted dehydrogenase
MDDQRPLVVGEDGRGVAALFQAIYQSNREGRSIKLGDHGEALDRS